MSMRVTILSELQRLADDQEKKLAPLTDDLVLMESGLDSFEFAILVSRLEDTLGFDPFSAMDEAYYPITLGDLIRFYENGARAEK
jgi:acyl carrier protein